ncbi:coiled-coil domain-containing protein MTMR15 [Metarhizium album ARSEF 1941]|uniref:Fanconi-associated nuclease n=1 Tax=Metarhizium album (strain ARSEF 1941) TaxID=1081103 RepID=A0A0B2WS43_METAS|nr:coiled-coil domain-containing protein MTMR15 [Metarhizium album ARSEF 1941]KHN96464.1 coiled-coil domain-containing protein MTMR15 [Metarhizium album ARSEF 1941]
MLHREYFPFLPTPESEPRGPVDQPMLGAPAPEGWWDDSSRLLFGAAEHIAAILHEASECGVHLMTPFAGFCAFSAGYLNLYVAKYPRMNLGRSPRASDCLKMCLDYLEKFRLVWKIADGWGGTRKIKTIHHASVLYERATEDRTRYQGRTRADFDTLHQSVHEFRVVDRSDAHTREIRGAERPSAQATWPVQGHEHEHEHEHELDTNTLLNQLFAEVSNNLDEQGAWSQWSDTSGESSRSASQYDSTSTSGRAAKRVKRDEVGNADFLDSEESDRGNWAQKKSSRTSYKTENADTTSSPEATAFENVLPPTQIDADAIETYERMRSSTTQADDDGATAETKPLWVQGRSSIYVDAFNLALDTVLEEESELFDEKEKEVFRKWKDLTYEAQYFRLGYHSDISELEEAIEALKAVQKLPPKDSQDTEELVPGFDLESFNLGATFTFADASEDYIDTVEEAASLLLLDELKALAKDAKIAGKNKAELVKGLCRMSQQQVGLMTLGLSRQNSRDSDASVSDPEFAGPSKSGRLKRQNSNRNEHYLNKMLAILGPCIRLSPLTYKLFERVHLVFYRSTEWTEKSLTTIILAKIARRKFPEYIVCRTSTIFASRLHLLEFEAGIRLEADVDNILESSGIPSEEDLQRIMNIFEMVYPRWKQYINDEGEKERMVYEMGEGAYLRRFNPAHSYTRIIVKAMWVMGRRKEYAREHELLEELLDQKLFHLARRGSWYQRKALLEEHYMPSVDADGAVGDLGQRKKQWKRIAATTCESALQDPDCHLIHHYDLQKRLIKLEKKLRIPRRLQHDFGHVRLAEPLEVNVEGIQLKRTPSAKPGTQQASTKTIWLDELDTGGECSVEEMCLSHFRSQGWKGYHAEGGAIRTIFAYLFYDILFLYIPNVFQTEYQTCPLDLHTDAFFPARASEINHRLVEIANGQGERLLRQVWDREHESRTSVVGLNWDFDVDDMAELVRCFKGSALAAICKVMAQEYKHRGGGVPDLILWRATDKSADEEAPSTREEPRGEVMFAEVKSANDRLSDTQRLWIHVLTGAGVTVALCNAIAKEVREVD